MLRIKDYAKRPVAEQARLSAQLDTVLALLLPAIPQQSRLVLADTGVAAVVVINNAPAALAMAEHALEAYVAGLGLCIGIDHGPVEVVDSEENEEQLAGDGITTASVLAASAADTGLLVSGNFRTALANMLPGAESALIPARNVSDAGLRSYQTYTLDREAAARRKRIFLLAAVISSVALLAVAVLIRVWMPDRPRPLAEELSKVMNYVGISRER